MESLLSKQQITPDTIGVLLFVRANKKKENNEYVNNIVKEYLYDYTVTSEAGNEYKLVDVYIKKGWVTYIKTATKKEPWKGIRLTDLGQSILDNAWNMSPQHEDTMRTYEYLKELYISHGFEDKVVSAGPTILGRISDFLIYKDYPNFKMVQAVCDALMDKFDSIEKKFVYNMMTLFFKVDNNANQRDKMSWGPDLCPLCTFINGNTEQIKEKYKNL